MIATLLHWLNIPTRAEVEALRGDAPPTGALPLYMCSVCHQCLTAAAFRAHLPGNHPPGAADYHRRHGLNIQEGHLQGGFFDYQTGEFWPKPEWYPEPANTVEPFPAPHSPHATPNPADAPTPAPVAESGTGGLYGQEEGI